MKCITCKGRGLCGRPVCPILRRLEETAALPRIGRSLEGMSPPEVFVGRHGYPLVRAGPLVPAGSSPGQLAETPGLGVLSDSRDQPVSHQEDNSDITYKGLAA